MVPTRGGHCRAFRPHAGLGNVVDRLIIDARLSIPVSEIEWRAVRSQGAGGQNVNKVASAVHLRFDAANSPSIPPAVCDRLLALGDHRVTADGVVVIKAQESRSQVRNREAALSRLTELLQRASSPSKTRIATSPSKRAKTARRDEKRQRGRLKELRGRIRDV